MPLPGNQLQGLQQITGRRLCDVAPGAAEVPEGHVQAVQAVARQPVRVLLEGLLRGVPGILILRLRYCEVYLAF